jgi:hypothetical protein
MRQEIRSLTERGTRKIGFFPLQIEPIFLHEEHISISVAAAIHKFNEIRFLTERDREKTGLFFLTN